MSDQYIEVTYIFRVLDENVLREVYGRYCEAFPDWVPDGLSEPAEIAEELISNLDLVSSALGGRPVCWNDLGLER